MVLPGKIHLVLIAQGGGAITVDFSNNILSISGEQAKVFIEFQIGKVNAMATYNFKPSGNNSGKGDYIDTQVTGPKGEAPYYYYMSDSLPGSVTITNYDPLDKIIEGTFSFDVANQFYPNLIKHITEGKFTVYYN